MGIIDVLRKRWILISIIIFLIGLLSYVLSFTIETRIGIESVWARAASDLGLALMIGMIVSITLDRLVNESLLRSVRSTVQGMSSASDVLAGAAQLGIEDVLARRTVSMNQRFEAKIGEAIQRQTTGEILIACVAAPDFFRHGSPLGDIIWKHAIDYTNNCEWRVLLLCPGSDWAGLRAFLEVDHPTLPDIGNAQTFLSNLVQGTRALTTTVEYKCYDCAPIAFLVITDGLIFAEPYPLSPVERGPIGGHLPMVIARKDSDAYAIWSRHFEYLWNHMSHECDESCLPNPVAIPTHSQSVLPSS